MHSVGRQPTECTRGPGDGVGMMLEGVRGGRGRGGGGAEWGKGRAGGGGELLGCTGAGVYKYNDIQLLYITALNGVYMHTIR
jgi:hypothetical protein